MSAIPTTAAATAEARRLGTAGDNLTAFTAAYDSASDEAKAAVAAIMRTMTPAS